MQKLALLASLALIIGILGQVYADSSPECDQACSDAESTRQQAESDEESRKQQEESDEESREQQERSDAESKKQQEESDKKSKEQQKKSDEKSKKQQQESDLNSFIQQTESDLKSQENRKRTAKIELVSETDNDGEEVQKLKFRSVGIESDLSVESSEDGKVRVVLSDGNYQDINVMPSSAFKSALGKLRTENINIRLEEFEGEDFATVYVATSDKSVKLLGLFEMKQELEVRIDASNGEVEFERPWWWFLVKEADEIQDIELQIIKPFQDIVIAKNGEARLDLDEYFLNAESYSLADAQNVTLDLNENILEILPEIDWTGTSSINVVAHNGDESLEGSFNVIVSDDNLSIQTVQYGAVIGEPVRWEKKVSGGDKVVLKLPKGSDNVVVKTDTSVISTALLRETQDDIEVEVSDAEDYDVEYYTDAPYSVEEKIEDGKERITVIGSEEVHYTDVLAFRHLESETTEESVRMFWVTESGKKEIELSKYDLNGNGLIDYIEWTVSSLSNETYELQFNVINVQSYPTVGGNWTVLFNTTGNANLTISAINGTSYGNALPDDLTPLQLRCGENILNYNWQNNSAKYANWSCNTTGYWVVKVLTYGVHTQEFNFGGLVGYAFNFASGDISYVSPTPANGTSQKVTHIYVNITSGESLNRSLLEWGNSSGYYNLSMTNSSLVNWFRNMTSLTDWNYNFTIWAQNLTGVWVQSERRFVTVDTIAPNISIIYPQNVSYNTNVSALNYTVTGANSCWYSLNGGTTNTSVACGTNLSNLISSEGSNTWRVYANDTAGNENSSNVTFFKDSIAPQTSFGSGTSSNYANVSRNWIYADLSYTEANVANATFALYNTSIVNSTTYNSTYSINWTGLAEGSYKYEINMTDITSNQNSTGIRHITLDRSASTISFSCSKFSYILGDIASCSCTATDNLDPSPTVNYIQSPSTSSVGTHTTTCTVTDDAGNSVSSDISYVVSSHPEGAPTYQASQEDLAEGYDRVLLKNWKANFNINNEAHTLTVKDVRPDSIRIVISSEPQEANISIGEEVLFELDGDDYYDLSVKLNSIESSRANITMKSVHQKILSEIEEMPLEEETAEDAVASEEGGGQSRKLGVAEIATAAGIIAVGCIIYMSIGNKKKLFRLLKMKIVSRR